MELTLFVIVGAIAVIAAAMMLISENAVYSALFLILNFACIAFLFLLLNAPFLALVQIAVYAGAIMVLFLFVIMLLGAERVMHFSPSKFRWLTPMAIGLALVFLITVSVAIIGGEIDLTEQEQDVPYVRAINAFDTRSADDAGSVDVYIDDTLLAHGVEFGDGSEYKVWDPGLYTVQVFESGADFDQASPLAEQIVEINDGEILSLVALGRADAMTGAALAVVTHDNAFIDDQNALWLSVVNALPDWEAIDVIDEGSNDVIVEGLAYGQAVELEVRKGTYDVGVYQAGDDRAALMQLEDEEFDAQDSVLLVFTEQWTEGNAFEDRILTFKAKGQALFGSPAHVGRLLFSRYVLPFEMVSLLLLVAMIGAIVLTHEALGKRRKVVRRLANPPAGLEKPITGEAGK